MYDCYTEDTEFTMILRKPVVIRNDKLLLVGCWYYWNEYWDDYGDDGSTINGEPPGI